MGVSYAVLVTNGNPGIIAGAYVERPALSAREPDNQPALCPDIQPSGFVANPGRPPPLETVHQPQTTPIVVYPAEENVQLPKGPGSGSKTPITSPGTGLAAANTLTGGKSSILTGGKATIPAGGKVTVPIGGKATLPTKGKTPITTSGPQGMVSVTWQRRLIGGLTTSKAEREKLEKHTYHQINKTGRLLDDDVVFAIAAVWQRLWTHKTRFAFCHADVFRWCRKPDSTDHGLRSVGAPHPLIMPLLFNPDDDPIPPQMMGKKIGAVRSEDGHFLLVIAERKSANANEVTLRIMDSAPGSMSSNVYRAAAQNIVRYSGWMGVDRAGKPLAVKPQFTEEIVNVPLQSDDVSCGVHVIFNAWAYMLGIPITPNAVRGNRSLYKEGRDLINLALTGCLNIQTIQAFLNSYRYSQPQSQQSLVAHLKTVGTNQAVVNAFLEPIQESELAAALA